jgi:hypothetical protein
MKNSFDTWIDTALKTCDMMHLSTHVIAQRTSRIALSAWTPANCDLREINLMGLEKYETGVEVMQAVVGSMGDAVQKISTLAAKHAFSVSNDLMLLGSSVTPGQANDRQIKIVTDSINHAIRHSNELSDSAARVAADGLEPIYQRTSTNAKRLAAGQTFACN